MAAVLIATTALPSHAQKIDQRGISWFNVPVASTPDSPKEPAYIWHPAPNELKPVIEKKAAKQNITLYANNRVMRMCREFRGCEKWARGKYALDSSFRITDVEITYWYGYPNQWEWAYALYVQTWENGHVHAYKLTKPTLQEVFPSWEEINKFPGHPFSDERSQHAKYPSKKEIYKRWSYPLALIYPKLKKMGVILSEKIAEEQIVVWENDEPIWKLRLYAEFVVNDDNNLRTVEKRIVREAKQEYPGGPFSLSQGKWKHYIL